jgi:hypothetical protein
VKDLNKNNRYDYLESEPRFNEKQFIFDKDHSQEVILFGNQKRKTATAELSDNDTTQMQSNHFQDLTKSIDQLD